MSDTVKDFKFSQCFGDKTDLVVTDADIISAVEFDHTGDYLATGDRGGRVVLFERNSNKKNACEYRFHTEFQSHDAEFDYLKSLEIEEKINKIKWCKRTNQAHFLLSANDKTIKLWKVYEKQIRMVSENNLSQINHTNSFNTSRLSLDTLKLPRLTLHDKIIAASPKRIYSNAHSYHINSMSINSDGETFISSDDLRINLWNLENPDQCFNIIDIKPNTLEELTEVITCAEFHPENCNLFMHSSSKGAIKFADMRSNALCDSHSKVFQEYIDPANHNFFNEITTSIADVKFSSDGRYIASRDYMTVKIWDVNMEKEPVKTFDIHEQLRSHLSTTYENDAIFDKFEVVFSADNNSVMTGSYNNNFMIYSDVNDPNKQSDEIVLQADRSAFKSRKQMINNNGNNNTGNNKRRNGLPNMIQKKNFDYGGNIDFDKNILHISWHPFENSVAIGATNNLYIFSTL